MLLASVEQGGSGLIEHLTELCDSEIFGWIARAPVQEFDGCSMACLSFGNRQREGILVLKCLENNVDQLIGCFIHMSAALVVD